MRILFPHCIGYTNLTFTLYVLQLEFYNLLREVNSPLQKHIPDVLGSGILYLEDGIYTNLPWDGKEVPDIITKSNLISQNCGIDSFSFGVWGKKLFEYRNAGMLVDESVSAASHSNIWPYIITKRCQGKMFAEL